MLLEKKKAWYKLCVPHSPDHMIYFSMGRGEKGRCNCTKMLATVFKQQQQQK